MQKKYLIILPFVFCLACIDKTEKSDGTTQEIAFDETKWKLKKDRDYPYRNSMLGDLMRNDKIRELKTKELLDMMGKPDRTDSSYLFYMITQKRIGFWPLHTKSLVIKLSEDSTINWMKIHE